MHPGVVFILYLAAGCLLILLFLLLCVRVSVFIEDTFCLRRKQRKMRKTLIQRMLYPDDPGSPRPAPPSDENITPDIICQPYIYRDAYSTGLNGLSMLANLPLSMGYIRDGNPSDAVVTNSDQMRVQFRRVTAQSSTENRPPEQRRSGGGGGENVSSSQTSLENISNHHNNLNLLQGQENHSSSNPSTLQRNEGEQLRISFRVATPQNEPNHRRRTEEENSTIINLPQISLDLSSVNNDDESLAIETESLPPDYLLVTTNNSNSIKLLGNGDKDDDEDEDELPPPSYYECVIQSKALLESEE